MDFTPRCPSCRAVVRWEGNPHRPFCSERCRLADLGGWVTEQYRIAGSPADPGPSVDDDDDENEPS
jgi:endogenous inhibitor of DNA gyrase (YacG/DUF329 family)